MRRSLLLSSILAVAACSSAPSENTDHVLAATTYANLTVTTKTANSVSLAWSYACDDNGMPSCDTPLSYFEVIRDGTLIWGSMSTSPWSGSFTDTGLLPAHLYTYTFCAVYQDSAQELPACVMARALTPGGGGPPPPPPPPSTDVYMVAVHKTASQSRLWQYSGSGTDWTAITGTNTTIKDAAETGNSVAMLANNGGPNQVWLRSGTTWNPISGNNTYVDRIYAGGGHFYMVGGNPYGTQLWRYSGSGYNWQVLTGSNTEVSGRVAATTNNLFMVAKNNGGGEQVWQYTGTGNDWIPITGANTKIKTIRATADHVYMLGNNGGADQVWQYSGSGYAWTSITGSNTTVSQLAASDTELAMLASNGGAKQVWLRSGSGWNAVTGDNTTIGAVWASPAHLFIEATNGPEGSWPLVWERTGNGWTALTGRASGTDYVVGSGR